MAAPAAGPLESMFGIDDSVLLGAVLAALVMGVAVMVAGAHRPRRNR